MSSSTTLLNHLLPADLFLPSSLPTTLLLPSKSPFLSLPTKPPSLSLSLSLSLKKKQAHNQTLTPLLVAQTSDWAQQEEESQVTEGAEEEFEGEGEAGGVVAEGEDAFVEGESGEDVGVEEEEEEEEEGEGYPEPPEDAKLFVGNLPYDLDSQRLAELFEKAGVVEVAEVIYNRETDQSRGFGFVTMSTVDEAEKAVEMFHRYLW